MKKEYLKPAFISFSIYLFLIILSTFIFSTDVVKYLSIALIFFLPLGIIMATKFLKIGD
ncbi:hypothetical protein [Metabacillus fastidiosus]|uniref:hypothetical protein n=1 Tax=Metabacillus fastidiosus TaxID=1458 RepID=UPI003D298A00